MVLSTSLSGGLVLTSCVRGPSDSPAGLLLRNTPSVLVINRLGMSSPTTHGQDVEEGLEEMWTESTRAIASIDPATENWKIQTLPLARIKKIMKSEEFIMQELEKEKHQKAVDEGQGVDMDRPILKFMISGEAPVLMSKACELLIKDLSFRAWRHTERNRRRTLQRQDLHAAVGESEVYDFLIDIVPRVTAPKSPVPTAGDAAGGMGQQVPNGMPMANMPTALPTITQPMGTAQSVTMDNTMMQQMHHHHQPLQQQAQQGLIQHQYADARTQQTQYQPYMTMAPAPTPTSDISHNASSQMSDVNVHQQWAPAPVPTGANNTQTG